MTPSEEDGNKKTTRRVTGDVLSPEKRKNKMFKELSSSSESSSGEDDEEEGRDNVSSESDSGDDSAAFASSTPVPVVRADDDSSSSSVNLDTVMNPFSSRLPTKPDKIVVKTLPVQVKVSAVKKSNFTESLTSLNAGIASLTGKLKSENDRYRDFHDSATRVCNEGKKIVDNLLKKAKGLESGLKKMKKQLSDSEEKLKKVTTEKDAANAAKDTLQLKYDILLGQNKKIEKECDELKGELKNMRKEARTGFPSQQQPDSSLQQLVAKEQVKLHMYEKKKAIERDDKKKADRQKQKQKQENVNAIANMGGYGFPTKSNSKVSRHAIIVFIIFSYSRLITLFNV
jgi:hypothetical protein